MKSKKSQTEILGLAVIVVFIAIGLLFAVKFIINDDSESEREEFVRSELASNLLGSMIDATTSCRNQDISHLLKDCAENNPGKISCNGIPSCQYVEQEINNIFSNFLVSIGGNKNFKFTATLDGEEMISVAQGVCSIWESANQPLPTKRGSLMLQFRMCR